MRTNQPLEIVLKKAALCVLLLAIILANGSNAYGQASSVPVNQFTPLVNTGGRALTTQNSSGVILVHGWTSPAANAIDADLTNKATWTSVVSLGSLTQAWLEVNDPNATGSDVYPVGSYAGFVIDDFGVLDLSNTVTVTTYLGGVEKESYTADGSVLAVSLLGGGKTKVGFITKQSAFDKVRITFNVVGVATSRSVYYAELLRPQAGPVPVCNTTTPLVQNAYPATVLTGTTGVATVSLLGSIFSDPGNVVDANTNNATTIRLPVGVLTSAYVSVKEAGAPGAISHPGGYFAGVEVSNGSLAELGLLSNSTITTYLDGVQKESRTGSQLLLSAPLLSGSSRSTIGFVTTQEFDEIRYTITQPLNVDLGTTSVYSAVIKQFCAGAPLVCNTLTRVSSVAKPLYIDAANTGVSGAVNLNLLSTSASYDNIIDGNAATFATMDFTIAALTAHSVAVKDALNKYPKGTYAGFDIELPTLLDVNVAGLITIQLLNNGTVVQSTSGSALLAGVSTGLLGQSSRLPVGIIAATQFDEVKMIVNKTVGANVLGTMKIYDFVMQDNSCLKPLPCNTTTVLTSGQNGFDVVVDGTKTGFSGAVSAVNAVIDPWNVVTPSLTDFTRIQLVGNVAAQGSVAVAAGNSVFPAGVFAGFLVRENGNSPLVLANLLKMIRITTYKRDANGVAQQVETKTGAQLLGLTALLPLLGNDHGIRTVGFITTQNFDEIQISAGGLVDVGLPRTLDVFGAAIDTRYVVPGTPGLNCSVLKTNPDINYTIVNKPVSGSVATNDKVPAGTTYSDAVAVNGADGLPNPSGGTLTLNADGSGNYTFVATAPGSYSYSITVTSGTNTEAQNLTINVTDPSITTNPPIANTDIAATNAGAPVTVDILLNDHAGNQGGTLGTPEVFKQGSNGTATMAGNKLQYTPAEGFIGRDTVVYKVCETPGTNLCGYAFVIVEVKPATLNTITATDDFAMTKAGVAVSGNVKDNDIDPDAGDVQTVTQQTVTDPTFGAFTVGPNGAYTFTPKAGFSGTARFAYEIQDDKGNSATATLYVYTAASGVDLSLSVAAEPSQVTGTQTVSLRIVVYTVNNTPTNGSAVYVRIPKSPNYTLDPYAPALTTISGQPVQNADWTYMGLDAGQLNHVFKLGGTNAKTVIAGLAASAFGCTAVFNGGSASGTDNIIVNIFGGSGGDSAAGNNSDTETIQYSNQ
ncbi:MAG: cadherin-like domain-containing protein [Niabella sp.]|nr:cadherin-like domain-containing protein [Niabella sp.]